MTILSGSLVQDSQLRAGGWVIAPLPGHGGQRQVQPPST
jgi:hypothetical protein